MKDTQYIAPTMRGKSSVFREIIIILKIAIFKGSECGDYAVVAFRVYREWLQTDAHGGNKRPTHCNYFLLKCMACTETILIGNIYM